jgi:hypothetical protein
MNQVADLERFLKSQPKKQAKELLDWFYEKGKQKQANNAAELWNKIKEHLPGIQKAHSASVEFLAVIEEARIQLDAQFNHELLAAKLTKNTSALKALPRVKKRWKAVSNGAQLKYGELRKEGILQLLRDKKIKAVWAKGEAVAGYIEALSGCNRRLSDDEWQGRFTVMEFRSGLEAMYGPKVAGDKEGKQVRRTLRALGIQEAEDQPGRKWKGPVPVTAKQEPKRRRGRPRIHPEIVSAGDTERAEGIQRAIFGARVNTTGHVLPEYCHRAKFKYGNTSYGGLSLLVESARKEIAAIEREIKELTMLRGGRRGMFVY